MSGRCEVCGNPGQPSPYTERQGLTLCRSNYCRRSVHYATNKTVDLNDETHGLCRSLAGTCEFTHCRHHLAVESNRAGAGQAESAGEGEMCSLRLADHGPMKMEEIAVLLRVTKQRIDQIEGNALHKLGRRLGKGALAALIMDSR